MYVYIYIYTYGFIIIPAYIPLSMFCIHTIHYIALDYITYGGQPSDSCYAFVLLISSPKNHGGHLTRNEDDPVMRRQGGGIQP